MDQQDHLEYQSVDTRTEVDNNCICLETACGDVDGDDCESGESSLRSGNLYSMVYVGHAVCSHGCDGLFH